MSLAFIMAVGAQRGRLRLIGTFISQVSFWAKVFMSTRYVSPCSYGVDDSRGVQVIRSERYRTPPQLLLSSRLRLFEGCSGGRRMRLVSSVCPRSLELLDTDDHRHRVSKTSVNIQWGFCRRSFGSFDVWRDPANWISSQR